MKMFNQTKKALALSMIMLVVCLGMLLGTTYAWFTDSASSGSNVIQAGTLDIVLEYWDGTQWVDAEGKVLEFQKANTTSGTNVIWEPGCTYKMPKFRIRNEGNLAAKILIKLNGVKGDEKLLEAVKLTTTITNMPKSVLNGSYGSVLGKFNDATVDLMYGTPDGTIVFDWSLMGKGIVSPNSGHTDTSPEFTISGHMDENAGNEYQGLKIEGISILVVATQEVYEYDSFGREYDKDSKYPIVYDSIIDASMSFDQIEEIFAKGGNIAITEDITVANPENSRFTEFNLTKDINIYINEGKTLTFNETTTFIGDKTVTVHSGSIIENQELCISENATIIFEGGEHTFNAFSATGNGKIVVNEGILNCMGTYAGILGITFGENGQLIVNGGKLNMYQPFNLNPNRCDNAYIEINGGEINLLDEVDKLFAVRNIMDKDRESKVLRGSSIKITGGVFTTTYPLDSTGDANAFIRNEDGNCDTTRVLDGNFYNGEAQYNCVVTGGTFYGCWTRTGETGGNGSEVCENTIAGFVAADYQITGDAINGYIVSKK